MSLPPLPYARRAGPVLAAGVVALLTAAVAAPALAATVPSPAPSIVSTDPVTDILDEVVVEEGELRVDLGAQTGPFKGGAAGALYGIYDEGMPTDNLIEGFGLQTNATKAQDGAQHPGSDALEVLGPLARTTGGDIYIRPTDYYRGFPYQWPGNTPKERLDDYFRQLETQIEQVRVLLAEQPGLADNIVIEPFNEPEGNMFGTGQWSYNGRSWLDDPKDYFAAWDRAHAMIKAELPGIPVAGPNTSVLYDQVRGFLQHTKDAGTAPEIITWHELSDPASVRRSVDRLRGWEDEIFGNATDRPINIDEYAFNYHTSVPGQMIQWISAFEDKKVDGMIAFWNLNGNLNDSAVQSNRGNGQWWLYNAYSGMTGNTVKVTPPQPGVSYTLQGVATLDEERRLAQAILGGKSGDALIAFDRIPVTMGDDVRVTVREIPWTGQIGDSPEPRHVAEFTTKVSHGSIELDFGGDTLPALLESSAYQILVSPVGAGESTSARPSLWEKSYEAENARHTGGPYYLNGPEGSPSNVAGFYTSNLRNVGALRTDSDLTLDFDVEVPEGGAYDLQVFTSTLNTFGSVQQQGPTNVFVRVDGGAEQELHLPLAYKWVVWDHVDAMVDLTAGKHTISLSVQSLDAKKHTKGDAIVDRIVLALPNPEAEASVYEAEFAGLSGGTITYSAPAGSGVSGAGGADLGGGDSATFWVYAAEIGEHTLDVDTIGASRGTLTVNGQPVPYLEGGAARVSLEGGVNKVVVTGTAWVDRLVVTESATWTPRNYEAENATLGGEATVVDLGLASGGKAVDGVGGEPGNQNTITFEVDADVAGLHAVNVRFSNPEQVPATHYNPNPVARQADVWVNGKLVAPREVFVPTFHRNNFWERTIRLHLNAGTNTITFRTEEEPNWASETYASDVWGPQYPGLILRSPNSPILDRISVTPFTEAGVDLVPTALSAAQPERKVTSVSVTVENAGLSTADGVVVELFDGATSIGRTAPVAVAGGASKTVRVDWDTKGTKGERSLRAVVDPDDTLSESNESNNALTRTVTVRSNKVTNGSYESSATAAAPDGWTSTGSASYDTSGSHATDGSDAVGLSGGPSSGWTTTVPVTAGETYDLALSAAGGTPGVAVSFLGSAGVVVSAIAGVDTVVSEIGTGSSAVSQIRGTVTVPAGVTSMRLRLSGPLAQAPGSALWVDDVWVW